MARTRKYTVDTAQYGKPRPVGYGTYNSSGQPAWRPGTQGYLQGEGKPNVMRQSYNKPNLAVTMGSRQNGVGTPTGPNAALLSGYTAGTPVRPNVGSYGSATPAATGNKPNIGTGTPGASGSSGVPTPQNTDQLIAQAQALYNQYVGSPTAQNALAQAQAQTGQNITLPGIGATVAAQSGAAAGGQGGTPHPSASPTPSPQGEGNGAAGNAGGQTAGGMPQWTAQEVPNWDPTSSQWYQMAQQYWDQINGRGPFQFDLDGNALYQQYKDQYLNNGRLAMQDTMGQAAGLTGGYGSSYSQAVGQQAYNNELQRLNERVPEIYELERSAYDRDTQDLYDRWNLANSMYNQELADWRYNDETAYGRAQDAYNNELAQAQLQHNWQMDDADLAYQQWQMQQSQQNQAFANAMDMWSMTGYANEYVASVLGVPVGTPTGSMAQYLAEHPTAAMYMGLGRTNTAGTGTTTAAAAAVPTVGQQAASDPYLKPGYAEWAAAMVAQQAAMPAATGSYQGTSNRPSSYAPRPTGTPEPEPTTEGTTFGKLAKYFLKGEDLPADYYSQVVNAYQTGDISREEANQLLTMGGFR